MNQQIDIQIDELVLHGFSATDAPHIQAAVERELSRLFSTQRLPGLSAPADVSRLNAGSFSHPPQASADSIGSQIAQSIFTGITHETGPATRP